MIVADCGSDGPLVPRFMSGPQNASQMDDHVIISLFYGHC
jgi:hypothetical protein